jgi:hypothetical protein
VTVRLANTLTQTMGQYSGSLYNITRGRITYLPRTPLFIGDINGDNAINILDYNILLNCWNQTGCSSSQFAASDLNDDSEVKQVDYNIWLRADSAVNSSNGNCSNGVCVDNTVW